MDNRKRFALVTGGARGIGKQIAFTLAENGYNIVVNFNKSKAESIDLVNQLSKFDVKCIAYECDVSDFSAVEKMRADLYANFGVIDTLINNAGIAHYNLFSDDKASDIKKVIDNDLIGAINVCNQFIPGMVSKKFGRVINIASVWGQTGASMEVLYSTAKAGIIGLTKSLALELAPSGITVNAISPGFISTEMNSHLTHEDIKNFIDSIPMCRAGTASDVADAVLFFSSKNASYITGQVLGVNGGLV